MNVNNVINEFVTYGINNELITFDDSMYVINRLLKILKLPKYDGEFEKVDFVRPIDDIQEDFLYLAINENIIENYVTSKDMFDTLIMDVITPRPSAVIKKFWNLYKNNGEDATDYFYHLAIACNYIRMNRIKKNIEWISQTPYGNMQITINMSKPEKDPKEIMRFKEIEKSNQNKYPKCLLCYENIGFSGLNNHPARNNLRVIPLKLNQEDFYLQYSPYVYYPEHCIVFKREHEPMNMSSKSFLRLLDFVDEFPHYFLGSNAALPIVGGSILSHEHYQGGKYFFPLDNARIKYQVEKDNVMVELLEWPLTTIRISSYNRQDIYNMGVKILNTWQEYTNEKIQIWAKDIENHNSITPIVRKLNGKYIINISLRNNVVTKEYPYGLYHPSEDLFHIKKENIGLIEVMGLAILPSRLKEEMKIMKDILDNKRSEDDLALIEKHRLWYYELKEKGDIDLENEIGKKFVKVLESCDVFKYGTTADAIAFINKL